MGAEPWPQDPEHQDSDAELLEHLLGSLLSDFSLWFDRGLRLLDLCPDTVMPPGQRQDLAEALQAARRELQAAVALRGATPAPMALSMETMAPWHQLVLRVWSLSARLRGSGVSLPPIDWPLEQPRSAQG
ncbi:MAG: DUF2605 family protein [Cyanobacteriota bacterium]|jgi:hypothetical protein|nr:DUF2605 family protein [Cyanobacteriota bacterium]